LRDSSKEGQTLKKRRLRLLYLLIVPILWLALTSGAFGQEQEICFPFDDAQKLYKIVEEHAIQGREIDLLKQQLSLTERESLLKDKVIELEQQRSKLFEDAFNKEKDLTDRALKLSEKKTPTFWEVIGGIGLIAIIITVVASVL